MPVRELRFTENAEDTLKELEKDKSKQRIYKDVRKTLKFMRMDLRHPSLNTHEFESLIGPNGEKVFEAYAQQNTPCAYRILRYYGPGQKTISIAAIIPHPD